MSRDTIRLGTAHDYVELQLLERGTFEGRNEGDLRLRVSVSCGTFTGSYDQVWIACDDWKSFLAELVRLEGDRSGDAALLVPMSPGEFELHIRTIDRAGHVAAEGFLSRYHFGHSSGNAMRSRVEFGGIEIDSSMLRSLIPQFKDFGESS